MTLTRGLIAFLLGFALSFCLPTLHFTPAHGHDAAHHELDQWFMGLKSGKGLCCDGKEALHLTDVDVQTQNLEHSHYKVKVPKSAEDYDRARKGEQVETEWVDVPDDAVIDEPNKLGMPMVWPVYGYYLGHMPWIRCFMPGAMG